MKVETRKKSWSCSSNVYSRQNRHRLSQKANKDPAILLLGIYPKIQNTKRHVHLYAYCSIIYNRQDMEAT